MDPLELSIKEMGGQLSFFIHIRDCVKDLDEKIRGASMFLAYQEVLFRHSDIVDWEIQDRSETSAVIGRSGEKVVVYAKVRTMTLHGRSSLGGRQSDAVKKTLEKLVESGVEYPYLFLLDPWTANVVRDAFRSFDVAIRPLLKEDLSAVVRSSVSDKESEKSAMEQLPQMVEKVITKDDTIPEDRMIVSPISRTSIRQGFLYIPKEKSHLLSEGAIKVFIRKDASIESKCMISATGGVRVGGKLTKWFRSVNLQANDELVMGSLEDGSLLVLMIRRANYNLRTRR